MPAIADIDWPGIRSTVESACTNNVTVEAALLDPQNLLARTDPDAHWLTPEEKEHAQAFLLEITTRQLHQLRARLFDSTAVRQFQISSPPFPPEQASQAALTLAFSIRAAIAHRA